MKDQTYAQATELKLNEIVVYTADKSYIAEDLKEETLASVLGRIRIDKELESLVKRIRAEQDEKKRKELKKQNLPYFTLARLKDGYRDSEHFLGTQYLSIDFDDVNGRSLELDEKLKADNSVLTFFRSPSDNRKVIYRLDREITDVDDYRNVYEHILKDLSARYGFNADGNTKDAVREIFLSFDPDLYVNSCALPLDTSNIAEAVKPIKKINLKQIADEDLKFLPSAIEFLKDKIDNYGDWIDCGFALASLGEEGRSYFLELSNNSNYKDSPEEIDSKFDNLLTTGSGDVTVATLFKLAIEYGYEYPEIEEEVVEGKDFTVELKEQFQIDDTRDPNKLLGLPLTKFNSLATNIDGIQPGFYFLGAESNVGKTAVLTNLALDVLDTNPDATVLYFSLDDSRIYTSYRCLSILTGFHINNVRKPDVNHTDYQTLQAQRYVLLDYIQTERLILKDLSEVNHMDHLMKTVDEHSDNKELVVLIDGLYNLEVSSGTGEGIRVQNIEKANKIKLITDKYRIPLIATGELRKKIKGESKNSKPTMHDLMETGKFAYNANVIWLLYPHDPNNIDQSSVILELEFAKNKLSDFKGIQHLDFFRSTGKMSEIILKTVGKKTLITSPNSGGDVH